MLLAATLPPVIALLTAGSPVLRVRCDGCSEPVDSLWSGEVWVWDGAGSTINVMGNAKCNGHIIM